MTIVATGGPVTSTGLSLLVVPVLYSHVDAAVQRLGALVSGRPGPTGRESPDLR